MQLVLFDFDGTLTRRDSLSDFLWFALGPWPLVAGLPRIGIRLLRLWGQGHWSNGAAKRVVLDVYFGGWPKTVLDKTAAEWTERRLPTLLRAEVLDRLRRYRAAGNQVVVVSASIDLWLMPFCEQEQVALLCTALAYRDGRFFGDFQTPNCNGPEKAVRIKAAYDLTAYAHIVAFGNSAGDRAMFALAQEVWFYGRHGLVPHFKNI